MALNRASLWVASGVALAVSLAPSAGPAQTAKYPDRPVKIVVGTRRLLEEQGVALSGEVLAHTRYLNGHVLFPYTALDHAVAMTAANYDPRLGTPLFDQTAVLLGTVIAKSQELSQAGIAVRTVTLIITDGGDYGSTRCKPADIKAHVADMLAQENHIVAAMGIRDGTTDFHQVFRAMGIPDRWILTPGNSASEIRRAFAVFSQSAVRASQGALLGGFSN